MVKYYPLTRIKTNLYTRGTTYKTADGKPYTGRYYLTYEGKAYTGTNPIVGTNQELSPIVKPLNQDSPIRIQQSQNYAVAKLQNTVSQNQLDLLTNKQQLEELQSYYPVVLDSDYEKGYFTRYFAKNVSGPGYIIEISQGSYASIQNKNYPADVLVYEVTSILWQLTGPLHDTRISQYQVQGGVYDTNKRVVEAKNLGFRGLVEFIGGDYTKYAKVTA